MYSFNARRNEASPTRMSLHSHSWRMEPREVKELDLLESNQSADWTRCPGKPAQNGCNTTLHGPELRVTYYLNYAQDGHAERQSRSVDGLQS
jgi:hypothetical protein